LTTGSIHRLLGEITSTTSIGTAVIRSGHRGRPCARR
jgi:hypothetical protein